MNGFGFAVGSAVLVVGGLGMYLALGPMREPPGLRGASEAPSSVAWEDEDPDPGQEARAVPGIRAATTQPDPSSPAAAPQTTPTDPGAAARPFPTARDIPVGLERAELLRRYGPPAMRTASVEQGVPVETMVYLQREPEAATFILLRAGRVASASTSSY